MSSDTDRIVKTVDLGAPLDRVWQAVADSQQFGLWFGVKLDGPFEPGARLSGTIVPTTVDPEVAKLQEPHAGVVFPVFVQRVEPKRLLSFRWHPYPVESADADAAPTTLVVFELAADGERTRLTITESGFDAIPLAHRASALESNREGWDHQAGLISTYLARQA
jgi:uncharacterized protein YndB with AHSA1/START domain